MLTIRPAKLEDLSGITQIYNEATQTTVATFDTEPKTLEEQRAWFENHGPKYPVLVAELFILIQTMAHSLAPGTGSTLFLPL